MIWRTSRRTIGLDRTLVMAILNVTPDSFSDGGRFASLDEAVKQTERLISEGADILDVGGESTRPGSARVSADEEVKRVVPVIEAVAKRFDVPVSIDTSKAEVARAAIDAGAEIVNDISGFIFDPLLACSQSFLGRCSARGNALRFGETRLQFLHSRLRRGQFGLTCRHNLLA
ncbi:MAG TPA: dihydropteroate synthase, partial [Pyrinomonadaceae bacterium]|nr:dihydropteroate synthase [Pyrinomonadaceae bacterium]